jgi:hypothetical protein
MEKLQFKKEINAPASKVFDVMLGMALLHESAVPLYPIRDQSGGFLNLNFDRNRHSSGCHDI